jgi:predicted membrane protein
MPIIILLFIPIPFLLFFYLAPRFFKWLMLANIALVALGLLGLTTLSFIFDARKFGANAGMLEDESIALLIAAWAIPVILIFGIITGIASRLFFKSK